MRSCNVYLRNRLAGILTQQSPNSYTFEYYDDYFKDPNSPAIAISFPKTTKKYTSPHLFPFFTNMLSEGDRRKMQARLFHVDEKDDFSILLETAQYDTIGAVTVMPIITDTSK